MKCQDGCGLDVPALSGYQNVRAEFIGKQKTETDFSFRLYNILGDHKLAGSTVTLDSLVDLGITVPDLTPEEVEVEYTRCKNYLKEA